MLRKKVVGKENTDFCSHIIKFITSVICYRLLVDVVMQQDGSQEVKLLSESLKLTGHGPASKSHRSCSC